MRKIKFRAWDKQESKWFDRFMGVDPIKGFTTNDYFVFEQFTGLQDKNGKEVFEGDIIYSEHFNPQEMQVEFIEGAFCFTGKDIWPIDINIMYPSTGCCFEVIGNIHEPTSMSEKSQQHITKKSSVK